MVFQKFDRSARDAGKLQQAINHFDLQDSYVLRFGDALLQGYLEALRQDSPVTIPLVVEFDKWSKQGIITCKGYSLEDPYQEEILERVHLGSLRIAKTDPEGTEHPTLPLSIEIIFDEPPTIYAEVALELRIRDEEAYLSNAMTEYARGIILERNQVVPFVQNSENKFGATYTEIADVIEGELDPGSSELAVSMFSPDRKRRVAEMLIGQALVTVTEISRIKAERASNLISDDEALLALNSVSKDFSSYCAIFIEKMRPTRVNAQLHAPGHIYARQTINDYVSTQPLMMLAEQMRFSFALGKHEGLDWYLGSEPDRNLRMITDQAIIPLLRYGQELTGVPYELHAFIATHQLSLLSGKQYERFADLCQSLVMDVTLPKEEREGFGVLLTEEKVRKMIEPESTVVFSVHSHLAVAGFGVLYTSHDMLKIEELTVVNEFADRENLAPESVGIMHLVATDKPLRDLFDESGTSIYRTLMGSVKNFCKLHGITHLIGEVWEDNFALHKHHKIGWIETGIERLQARHDGVFRRIQVVYDLGQAEPGIGHPQFSTVEDRYFLRAEEIMGSPGTIVEKRKSKEDQIISGPEAMQHVLGEFIHLEALHVPPPEVTWNITSGNELNVTIRTPLRAFHIRQVVREQDVWDAQIAGYGVNSFAAIIKGIRTEFCNLILPRYDSPLRADLKSPLT